MPLTIPATIPDTIWLPLLVLSTHLLTLRVGFYLGQRTRRPPSEHHP